MLDELAQPNPWRPHGGPDAPTAPALSGYLPQPRDPAARKNMLLLINLRWFAVAGQLLAIGFASYGLGIALPITPMLFVLGALVALNLTSLVWLIDHDHVSRLILLAMLVLDLAALTTQLYLSGGASNPFASLYLLQVALAPVLLDTWASWLVVALATASLTFVAAVHQPLSIPTGDRHAIIIGWPLTGSLVCFALEAALVVSVAGTMMRNLRDRDARLAALRQHAAEEDHIVRMGLLASGAAHELGTPLSSMSVILGDWQRMGTPLAASDLAQELREMQTAVQRCKSIVTGILLSSGEARAEAPVRTSVHAFAAEVVAQWRSAHSAARLDYQNHFGADLPIVSDIALKQAIFNILENAYESSPAWIGFQIGHDRDLLLLRVRDRGPGFSPEMLRQFGRPYRSSKDKAGGGLGLFLVVNVIRKLGGSVQARNDELGGAEVTVSLPLTRLRREPASL
jgi:two-component system sensor histidine kinase RegB